MGNVIKYTPTTQTINTKSVKTPCVARVYRDGQWRQCRIQYYKLHPLISSYLQEQLLTIDNKPLFVAQKFVADSYQQVEYIEATGTQWIDSGFTPNQNTRVVLDCQYDASTNGTSYLFGVRQNGTSGMYSIFVSSGIIASGYGVGTVSCGNIISGRHIIDKNKNIVYNGVNGKRTQYESTFTCPGTMSIFACNSYGNNNQGYSPSKAKLYSMKIYDNDILVRDFVPCHRISDDEIGLYDRVNNKFYTNNGTGKFIAGPMI